MADRPGGWLGGVFLDGGSGFDIGQRVLAAAARALDGRDPAGRGDRLAAAVLEAVGARDAEELLAWAYDPAGGGVPAPGPPLLPWPPWQRAWRPRATRPRGKSWTGQRESFAGQLGP